MGIPTPSWFCSGVCFNVLVTPSGLLGAVEEVAIGWLSSVQAHPFCLSAHPFSLLPSAQPGRLWAAGEGRRWTGWSSRPALDYLGVRNALGGRACRPIVWAATSYSSQAPQAQMGKEKAWRRKSQKTLGEWNFRNGKSELIPAPSAAWAWGLAEIGFLFCCFCSAFGWAIHTTPF